MTVWTVWEMIEWQRRQIEKEWERQEKLLELYRFKQKDDKEGGEEDEYDVY